MRLRTQASSFNCTWLLVHLYCCTQGWHNIIVVCLWKQIKQPNLSDVLWVCLLSKM